MGLINIALVSPLIKRLNLNKRQVNNNHDLLIEYSNNSKELGKLQDRRAKLVARNKEIENRLKLEVE